MKWSLRIVIVPLSFCFVWLSGCYQSSASSSSQDTVQTLIGLLHDNDDVTRRTAAEALGKIGDPQAAQGLALALSDPAAIVREAAAHSLGQVGPVGSITTERLAQLLIDPAPSVRTAATRTLASFDQGKKLWPMWKAQLAHTDPDVRRVVIHALEGIDKPDVVEALSKAVEDSNSEVRRAAVGALAESGDERVAPLLRNRLSTDPSSVVRAEAAYRLQFVSVDENRQELSFVVSHDESLQVRRWAEQTLRETRARDSDSALRPVLPIELGPSH